MKKKSDKPNKAYKFRMYPTAEQKKYFAKAFGCVRFVYNRMLADKLAKKKSVTPAKYKAEFEWLAEVDSLALCNAQMNLKKAFSNRKQNPKHFGKPRFKSKKNRQSYSTNNQKGSVRIENGKIKLPKIGFVKIKQHREIDKNCTIKTVTISKTPTNDYYVSILVEYESQVQKVVPKSFVGLDYSMHELYVSSDGDVPKYPKFYRKSEKKLSRVQRWFSRKVKDSNNREKFRKRLSKIHERTANRRKDFLHKLSYNLIAKYDCICVEDLNMQGMSKALKFGKSVHDNGFGMFQQMLKYKCDWFGKTFVKIDKFFASSQKCHCCGYKNPATKDLSVREWRCPNCGAYHDRDVNAAINIREAGKKLV